MALRGRSANLANVQQNLEGRAAESPPIRRGVPRRRDRSSLRPSPSGAMRRVTLLFFSPRPYLPSPLAHRAGPFFSSPRARSPCGGAHRCTVSSSSRLLFRLLSAFPSLLPVLFSFFSSSSPFSPSFFSRSAPFPPSLSFLLLQRRIRGFAPIRLPIAVWQKAKTCWLAITRLASLPLFFPPFLRILYPLPCLSLSLSIPLDSFSVFLFLRLSSQGIAWSPEKSTLGSSSFRLFDSNRRCYVIVYFMAIGARSSHDNGAGYYSFYHGKTKRTRAHVGERVHLHTRGWFDK